MKKGFGTAESVPNAGRFRNDDVSVDSVDDLCGGHEHVFERADTGLPAVQLPESRKPAGGHRICFYGIYHSEEKSGGHGRYTGLIGIS